MILSAYTFKLVFGNLHTKERDDRVKYCTYYLFSCDVLLFVLHIKIVNFKH